VPARRSRTASTASAISRGLKIALAIWDTSRLSPYLWGMVSELSSAGAVPSSVVAAAVSGDAVAFARIVSAHHDDMARVWRFVCCASIRMATSSSRPARASSATTTLAIVADPCTTLGAG
jgi:hypothetical protein